MRSAALAPDHPLRASLADEVHARPPEPVETPSRATYVALLVDAGARDAEQAHLAELCTCQGVAPPPAGATHFSADLGVLRVKWERHGEFSGFTMLARGLGAAPFAEPASSLLPEGWLARWPGRTMVAAHARLVPGDGDLPDADMLAQQFAGHIVVGAEIGEGAGMAFTDFRLHADGFSRYVVCNRSFTPRQAGRMLQRLFEIEAYRMMALLALPLARELSPQLGDTERALAALTERIAAGGGGDDEALLQELTRLAANVERNLAASQFRFGACRAYHELVTRRIAELRERRLPGIQTIDEFMARRLTPAVATVATVAQRMHELSERVAQASSLLSTRVDIARERQNQALLASMDRRAKLQLRLQQTVEGLSVAAITYYVIGLVAYGAKAGKAAGWSVDPDLAVGIAIPIVALAVLLAVRRARQALHRNQDRVQGP
jgi:uncharacterized membrane-anchored protein